MEAKINIDRIGDDLVAAFNDGYQQGLADARAERKTGKWIFKKPPDDWIMSLYMCDQCHHWEEGKPNYCPNCGATMVTDDV